ILMPFFSNFVLTFSFFLTIMGIIWILDWMKNKHANWPFFSAVILMISIYLIKNYLLIYSMFFTDGFTSHRNEYSLGHNNLIETLQLFVHNFLNGHTHDMAIHTIVILPVIGLAIL